MGIAVQLRSDYTADDLRALARDSCDSVQTRRLLSLAEIYDGGGPCNLTSGNSFGVCALCPTGGMPPVGWPVILLFHDNDQISMEVTKCGNHTIQSLQD